MDKDSVVRGAANVGLTVGSAAAIPYLCALEAEAVRTIKL